MNLKSQYDYDRQLLDINERLKQQINNNNALYEARKMAEVGQNFTGIKPVETESAAQRRLNIGKQRETMRNNLLTILAQDEIGDVTKVLTSDDDIIAFNDLFAAISKSAKEIGKPTPTQVLQIYKEVKKLQGVPGLDTNLVAAKSKFDNRKTIVNKQLDNLREMIALSLTAISQILKFSHVPSGPSLASLPKIPSQFGNLLKTIKTIEYVLLNGRIPDNISSANLETLELITENIPLFTNFEKQAYTMINESTNTLADGRQFKNFSKLIHSNIFMTNKEILKLGRLLGLKDTNISGVAQLINEAYNDLATDEAIIDFVNGLRPASASDGTPQLASYNEIQGVSSSSSAAAAAAPLTPEQEAIAKAARFNNQNDLILTTGAEITATAEKEEEQANIAADIAKQAAEKAAADAAKAATDAEQQAIENKRLENFNNYLQEIVQRNDNDSIIAQYILDVYNIFNNITSSTLQQKNDILTKLRTIPQLKPLYSILPAPLRTDIDALTVGTTPHTNDEYIAYLQEIYNTGHNLFQAGPVEYESHADRIARALADNTRADYPIAKWIDDFPIIIKQTVKNYMRNHITNLIDNPNLIAIFNSLPEELKNIVRSIREEKITTPKVFQKTDVYRSILRRILPYAIHIFDTQLLGSGLMQQQRRRKMIRGGAAANSMMPAKNIVVGMHVPDIPNALVPFGHYFINQRTLLKDKRFNLLKNNGGTHYGFHAIDMHDKPQLYEVLTGIVKNGEPDHNLINKLSNDDKIIITKIFNKARIPINVDYEDHEMDRFELLKAHIMAGGNNPEELSEFVQFLRHFAKTGRIKPDVAIDIIAELKTI